VITLVNASICCYLRLFFLYNAPNRGGIGSTRDRISPSPSAAPRHPRLRRLAQWQARRPYETRADRPASRQVDSGDENRLAGSGPVTDRLSRSRHSGGSEVDRRRPGGSMGMLADAAKDPFVWKAIVRQVGPQALRMIRSWSASTSGHSDQVKQRGRLFEAAGRAQGENCSKVTGTLHGCLRGIPRNHRAFTRHDGDGSRLRKLSAGGIEEVEKLENSTAASRSNSIRSSSKANCPSNSIDH